jgi:hypothetical protein
MSLCSVLLDRALMPLGQEGGIAGEALSEVEQERA